MPTALRTPLGALDGQLGGLRLGVRRLVEAAAGHVQDLDLAPLGDLLGAHAGEDNLNGEPTVSGESHRKLAEERRGAGSRRTRNRDP